MTPTYRPGEPVMYHGRLYRILTVVRTGVCGPHYRLSAEEPDASDQDLTSEDLIHRPSLGEALQVCRRAAGTKGGPGDDVHPDLTEHD